MDVHRTRRGRGSVVLLVASGMLAGHAGAQQRVELPAQDRPLSVGLEDVFTVGAFDGAPWETFGDIGGVAFDADGRLYVFDRQSSRVVVVGEDGKLVREEGKAGEGPGELRVPMSFTVLRDGTVVIADIGHRGYSVYGPDGAFQRLVSFGGGEGMIRTGDIVADPRGGSVLTGGGRTVIAMSRDGESPDTPPGRPIDRVELSGETAEVTNLVTAWQPPRPEGGTEMAGGGMRIRMDVAAPRAFEPPLAMGPLPDGGVAYTDSSAYAVKIIDADGTPVRTLYRSMTPRPMTKAIEEGERARRLKELEEGGGPRVRMMVQGPGGSGMRSPSQDAIKEMMKGQIAQLGFYPEVPVILDLGTGWTGKIWVVRRGEQPAEPGAIDVLTADGQYVGTFAAGAMDLPDAFGPDGLVAFITKDDMDVPHVEVKRLPGILR